MPGSQKYLHVYLQDHRAGAVGGVRLARRCAAHSRDTELHSQLTEIARHIEDDARSLDQILERLGIPYPRIKVALVRTGEWLGRVKLNGRVFGRSPLTQLVEVEGLIGGVELKRQLWVTLALLGTVDEGLSGFDFGRLEQRASDQLQILQAAHDRFASDLDSTATRGRDEGVASAGPGRRSRDSR